MKTISATNLRVQLRDLLTDLDTGPVSITKHGKVVAVLSAPSEPVEAVEVTSPTEDTAETPDAPQAASEVEEDNFSEEEEDPGEWDEGLDDSFEAYLSQHMPMDRPML